jgi:hypothetical protein
VALGLLMVGLGKPAGFAQFGDSAEAFLASLAPLLAFFIVLGALIVWAGHPLLGLAFFLTMVCDLLAPVVIADVFCRLWHRRDRWARYANVLNCTQWLMAAAMVILVPIAALVVSAGVSLPVATGALLIVFSLYVLWFHWFAARHVLDLSRGRALVVMLAVVFGTGLVLHLPVAISGFAGVSASSTGLEELLKPEK